MIRLCRETEIEEGQARGFKVGEEPRASPVFVVRWDGALKGYLNACPHVGTQLDWIPGKFFHPSEDLLICATHGALFRPEDGRCVAGPCEGEALQPVDVAVEDGWIVFRDGYAQRGSAK